MKVTDFVNQPVVLRCAELFHVDRRDLMGNYRFKFLMPAKFALCAALRAQGFSYSRIGKFLGRDHSTIIYAVDRAHWQMSKDPQYKDKIDTLAGIPVEADHDVR